MKILRVFMAVILFTNATFGQTYDEWFRQKKTQINYLVKQIAALQAYATVAKNGYDIVHTGLDVIQNIKKGDFSLHDNYFSSLKNVNPTVKAYTKIASIIAMQVEIVEGCHQQRLQMNKSKQFNSDEINYAGKVFDQLLDGCAGITDQLIIITTDGLLQMKDDERIRSIDQLYNKMCEQFQFVQHFGSENNVLAIQRMKDQNDVNVLKGLYGQ